MGRGIIYGTGGKDCPCHGCGTRSVGCHGECGSYRAWNEKRQTEKRERFRRTSLLREAGKRKQEAVENYRRRGRQV